MRRGARAAAPLAMALLLPSCVSGPASAPTTRMRPPKVLHILPTQVRTTAEAGAPLRVSLHAPAARRLEALVDAGRVVEASANHVTVEFPAATIDASAIDGTPDEYRSSTFVIDWETPEVRGWGDEIVARFGESPSPEQIAQAVASGIEASGSRGFDIASQVARNRTGDCTEHAVAFAALARRFGHPSRVVMGIVVVHGDDGSIGSFGHAWAEVATPQGWRLLDPTEIEGAVPMAYVPTGWLSNEGPGYVRALAGNVVVERVEILAPASD